MRRALLLLTFAVSVVGLRGAAPHPTVVTAKYGGHMLPVVKVIQFDPVVLVDGHEKRIRAKPNLMPERVEDYSKEYVQVLSQHSSVSAPFAATNESAMGTGQLQVQLKSKNAVKGGFILIGFYGGGLDDLSTFTGAEYLVRPLPELPAGVEVKVEVTTRLAYFDRALTAYFQIFDSEGREIPTDALETPWKYYALLDKFQLKRTTPGYLQKFADQDHEAFPVIRPKPLLKDGLSTPTTPVSALMTVNTDGMVENVVVTGAADPAVRGCIEQALGGWMFFPRLKSGKPVPTKILVPIQF